MKKEFKPKARLTPTQSITLGFLTLILIGAFILFLPISYKGESPSIIDCIFTATSAVCVTGLVVVDTATTWTFWGQVCILILIQIGSIGFMTLLTILFIRLKRRISYSDKLIIKESFSLDTTFSSALPLVKRIVKITFIIEVVGSVALMIYFVPLLGFFKGLWYSIFHAISAFCNAGFDLMGEISGEFSSITLFRDSILFNFIISSLIILGGIGFPVIKDILSAKKFSALSLHSKVVIITTTVLVLGGGVAIFLLESNNPHTLEQLSVFKGLNASLFQSVTSRTAGFNTINLSAMRIPTLLILLALMLIGSSPVSTGGGIKTTAFFVIFIYLKNRVLGKEDNSCFKKEIPQEVINRSITSLLLVCSIFFMTTISLTIVEPNLSLISSMFESASAIATVGLSLGGTITLSPVSKLILIFSMFLGRVGITTVSLALSSNKSKNKSNFKYTEESILI